MIYPVLGQIFSFYCIIVFIMKTKFINRSVDRISTVLSKNNTNISLFFKFL